MYFVIQVSNNPIDLVLLAPFYRKYMWWCPCPCLSKAMLFPIQHGALHSRQDCRIDMVGGGEPLQVPNSGGVSERGLIMKLFTAHGYIYLRRTRKSFGGTCRTIKKANSNQIMNSAPKICILSPYTGNIQIVCIHTIFCLHPNWHKSMILLGSVSLQFMMLSDYQIQFIWQWKEIVLCYCPPCVGNCIFDQQSYWPSSCNSWERELVAGASGEKSQEPVPRLPPPIEGEAAPIPVVLWTMFVICWFSLANTYTNNYPCKRMLY